MRYEEIVHRCFRCGYCKLTSDYAAFNCPPYRKFMFDTYAPGGRMWLIRGWLNGDLANTEHLQKIIFSCATCGNCVEHCAFNFRDDLINVVIAASSAMRQSLVLAAMRLLRCATKDIHLSLRARSLGEAISA